MEKENDKRSNIFYDIDDNKIFSDALEFHYINMKAFAKAVNKNGGIGKCETEEVMFAKWLAEFESK